MKTNTYKYASLACGIAGAALAFWNAPAAALMALAAGVLGYVAGRTQ